MANRNSEFGGIMPISGNLSHEGRMAVLRAFGDGAKLMSNPDGTHICSLLMSSMVLLGKESICLVLWIQRLVRGVIRMIILRRPLQTHSLKKLLADVLFCEADQGILAVIWQVLRTSLIRPRLNCRLTISIANS